MEDEVLVKQPDGSFKLVKVSELAIAPSPPPLTPGPLPQGEREKIPPSPPPSPSRGEGAAVFVPAIERYDQTAEELVRQSEVAVAPELHQRLKVVVISRLKDIRKKIETVEKLQMPKERGGLGLTREQAEKMLKLIEERRGTLSSKDEASPASAPAPAPVPAPARPSASSPPAPVVVAPSAPLKALPPEDAHGPHRADLSVLSPPSRLAPPPPPRPSPPPSPSPRGRGSNVPPTSADIKSNIPPAIKITGGEGALKVVPAPRQNFAPQNLGGQAKPPLTMAIPQTLAGKSKVEDVAYRPRLVGPLEELQSLTLTDWRRLSANPNVAADKIYAKIELLAATSFEEKVKGIRAWQGSEVNRLYLEILNDSLTKMKPVSEIIKERPSGLNEVEWQAMMELNRKLRL